MVFALRAATFCQSAKPKAPCNAWQIDLAWAAGSYPTPHGPIHVRHARGADGAIVSAVHAPPEVTVAVAS